MERVPTKTLAEIYLQQGHFEEAYEIFKALSEKDPSNQELKAKLKELETALSTVEKIRILKQWLAKIQERKSQP
jgi:thioredoxin-like negative regulator of GroEL